MRLGMENRSVQKEFDRERYADLTIWSNVYNHPWMNLKDSHPTFVEVHLKKVTGQVFPLLIVISLNY